MQRHMWQSSPLFGGSGVGARPGFLPQVALAGGARGGVPMTVAPVARGAAFGLGASSFSGQPGSQVALGQADVWKEWYERARAAVAKYEFLLEKLDTIGNQAAIEEIKLWLGSQNTPGTPAYRYVTVVSDMKHDVERFTPPNYSAYQVERRRNRIEKLEDFNSEFEARVEQALTTYGERRTVTVTRTDDGRQPQQDLTLPLALGGGAIALAIVLTSI